eukprot:CAMPEP_0179036010 /NCGR_PEP_ID=MMETSP0796-20121207/13398_1 /TAXON_ID=73915 /ORGANISM="Pyrodinium bahamense, Strain pbaha01" /LENGTH=143 /DNA_ID=CAMNT_0020732285 /DNA_START=77 /DNA_END=505 /DNA_ORIENTATION=-
MPILLGQKEIAVLTGHKASTLETPCRQRGLNDPAHDSGDPPDTEEPKQMCKGVLTDDKGLNPLPHSNLEDEIAEVAERWRSLASVVVVQCQDGEHLSDTVLCEIHAVMKRLSSLLEAVTNLPEEDATGPSMSQAQVRSLLVEV